ncbi:hypothetical protein AMTR_s00076p00079330 [Amborella trichopoda]|uniref:Uncharacterized protein n=1 Tax=Amborella trichopoda TaxID=13333 RepID=W1PAN9_AMBTC|nr:hypothetical protein AMTR_s00076p00079330 [Amborella trichopoda]
MGEEIVVMLLQRLTQADRGGETKPQQQGGRNYKGWASLRDFGLKAWYNMLVSYLSTIMEDIVIFVSKIPKT